MTERDTGTTRQSGRESMATVSHSAPQSPRNVFSEMFRRGQVVQADGGRETSDSAGDGRESSKRGSDSDTTEVEMREVDHETPDDEGVARVWNRGVEDSEE